MIWPSGCAQRLPAETKATAAAFIMISIDISTNRTLRRTRRPTKPSANSTVASSSPCSIGTRCALVMAPQVIGGDQRAEQQHRGELHRQQIRAVQRGADARGAHFLHAGRVQAV